MIVKKALFFWSLSIAINVNYCLGQNLVPNPSFEDYKRLPCGLNLDFIQDLLEDWNQPIRTDTDYWNKLSDTTCFLNPRTIFTDPKTGSGMTGIIGAVILGNTPNEYKEYLQVKLTDSLRKGKFYYGEFFAFNINRQLTKTDIVTSNNLGLAFSRNKIFNFDFGAPNHFFLDSKIKEKEMIPTGIWKRISGCFVADQPYEHLLIGNFDPIKETEIMRKTVSYNLAVAYYLIDDVSLVELPYNVLALEKNITQCNTQDSIVLNALVPGATQYEWNTGSHNSSLTVRSKEDAEFTVKIHFNECVYEHSFTVDFVPDINLGKDTVLCQEETLVLEPKNYKNDFYWNDGSSNSKKKINIAGNYWVEVPSPCIVQDTIQVSFTDCPGFIPNVFTPNGDYKNPSFYVENIETKIWSLQVFNRWGETVYETHHYNNDWNGAGLNSGIYYYRLYSSELNKELKGWVQLIR